MDLNPLPRGGLGFCPSVVVYVLFVDASILCVGFVLIFVLFCGVVPGALLSLAIILLRKKAGCFALIALWLSVFCVSPSGCRGSGCGL